MTAPVIEFWFDFSSSYAYFASLEIEALAERHGRTVVWRPFMLGAAFEVTGARGLSRTPMKKDYARHDWARIARHRGVPFRLPLHHPSVALPATRAFYALDRTSPEAAVTFAKGVFSAYFRAGLDTADAGQVADLALSLGHDRAGMIATMGDPEIKALAQARSAEALSKGVFGSPWFFVDGEPFWGADRLDHLERRLAAQA